MELLSPAGNFETALVAFANGADAVYAGMDTFSARAEADNFNDERMRTLVDFAHANGKKVYITFNTVIDEANLPEAVEKLAVLEDIAPDGIIVQDLGIARIVKEHFPSLALHASTQLVAHNLEGVLALKELGFVRVVLARELSLAEIELIRKRSGVEIEVFVHGALCYSISGLCLFSAMENNRSGNKGRCAYCCRLSYTDASSDSRILPFSMRDLRLDESLRALSDAGVDSAKIEGRMKSPLYVASVTKRYRQLLDGDTRSQEVTRADLETVFSRRTTTLYANDPDAAPETIIDPSSLGHLGTPVGVVKRITKDRDNRSWLRFHTTRAIEKHDGLQFLAHGGKPFGFGIVEMRKAISRNPVFEAAKGDDVEVLIPPDRLAALAKLQGPNPLSQGATVFCSASNAVKRRFPIPPFRPSEVTSQKLLDVTVTISANGIAAEAQGVSVFKEAKLEKAAHPERTFDAVKKAFSRMGETKWALGELAVKDDEKLFAPPSILNETRRLLAEKTAMADDGEKEKKIASIVESLVSDVCGASEEESCSNNIKLRLSQTLPDDEKYFDEIVFAIGRASAQETLEKIAASGISNTGKIRLALPAFTQEKDFASMRRAVKQLAKAGFAKWEAADIATLRLLKNCSISDITADWTFYAFNSQAAKMLMELGVKRAVASPENSPSNLKALSNLELPFEFLDEQSTPLFISLTKPMAKDPSLLTGLKGDKFTSFEMDGLWITTRVEPRSFSIPPGAKTTRTDISWTPDGDPFAS